MKNWSRGIVLMAVACASFEADGRVVHALRQPGAAISGELRQWHKVTLTIDGPWAHEEANAVLAYDEARGETWFASGPGGRFEGLNRNPYLDYRMTVTFAHESGEPTYDVPGYFAADGNAANTSAASGDKWHAHFSPDKTGPWNWRVSFVEGPNVAVDDEIVAKAEPLAPYHGLNGSFEIAESDKRAPDFRARGRLEYVGAHYLRFAGTGEYFLKAGPDSPETLLAYTDFDGTYATVPPGNRSWIGPADGHGLHEYATHVKDWREGDPTWKDGRGKGLIGAINYISSMGMNSMSFIPYTAGGDGENVWPFVSRNDKLHYDASKLDQWQIVFDHAQQKGVFLHFKLQEQENDDNRFDHVQRVDLVGLAQESLDGGELGVERRLYLRELIARFGYSLAMNWNIGEENTQTPAQQRAVASYIRAIDPYDHHIVIHTYPTWQEVVYPMLLGDQSHLTGASLQVAPYTAVHERVLRWVTASREAGKPWAVADDEQGPASFGTPPDPGYDGWTGFSTQGEPVHDLHDIRKYALWGSLMAGGWGIEYYFGYRAPHNDLVAESWRSREMTWGYARNALDFFTEQSIPFWEMENCDLLVGNYENDNSRYCFAKLGDVYLVYLPDGGTADLDLSAVATGSNFTVGWYDPRNGGDLQTGSTASVQGSGTVSLGAPPHAPDEDWLAVVRARP